MKKLIFAFLGVFGLCAFAWGEYNEMKIPSSQEIRSKITGSWLMAPLSSLRNKSDEIIVNNVGTRFQVRLEENDRDFAIVLAPETKMDMELRNGDSVRTVKAQIYPKGAAGSWVLYRNKKTEESTKIEWYFNPDSDVHIEFRPMKNKTYVDLVVFGSYLARSVPVGVPFTKLYSASFQDVRRWTKTSLPWDKIQVVPGQYRDSLYMVSVIKENLGNFEYDPSTCYDEKGQLIDIFTGLPYTRKDDEGKDYVPDLKNIHLLSGAGFVKWIVDGIVEPATGRGTKLQDLTSPTIDYSQTGKTGVMSQDWNLFFTLDWVRNLGAKAMEIRTRRDVTFETGGIDVIHNYFVSDLIDGKLVSSVGYIKNTGYSTDRIKSMLYVLAVTEPSWFFLGAIRQPSAQKPDEIVFNDCAVFFPYFDDKGRFGCFVFEKGEVMSIEKFISRHKGSFVHLERIKATQIFFPYKK